MRKEDGEWPQSYLRSSCRFHNLALDLGWLAWPLLAKRAWPKMRSTSKRAITPEEHARIVASEQNPERRAYYELLYETGAAQTDAAEPTYCRKKLGEGSEPARLTIGRRLRELL